MSFGHLRFFLLRILFRSNFSIGLFGILMSSLLSSLHILKIILLLNVGLEKIFPHSVGCCFVLLSCPCLIEDFQIQKVLFVAVNVCATSVVSEGNLLYQCIQGYFPLSVLSALV